MYKYLLAFLLSGCASTNLVVSTSAITGALVSTSALATTAEHTTVTLPTERCADHATDSEVLLIDEASDFSQINSATIDIFCVEPGDYTVDLDLTQSGTVNDRRYILYYNTAESSEVHPALQDEADRAIIEELFFLSDTEYWVVDRITIRDPITHSAVRMQPGGGNNIHLQRCLVEDTLGSSGMIAGGGDKNVIQDCVIRKSGNQPGLDDHGIVMYGTDMKIVGNEIYNVVGDAIQVSGSNIGGLIAHNELYITEDYYTDCAGNFDTGGNCMCAENALDFKGGGGGTFPFSEANQLLVKGNKIWGWNRDDDSSGACATGAGNIGIAVIMHGVSGNGDGVVFEDNIITSGPNNIESIAMIGANPTAEYYTWKNNLIYGLEYVASLPPSKTHNYEFYYNTFSDIRTTFHIGSGDENDWLCNVIIDSVDDGITSQGGSDLYDYNTYYNSDDTDMGGGANDEDYPTAAESNNETISWTKFQITNPTVVNVSLAGTTASSPHADICADPTETANRGVDNVTQLNRARAGFVAPPLELTIEADDRARH